MTYSATIEFLFSQLPMYQRQGTTAFKKDLTNIISLCNNLDNPQDKFRSIHIAGTNGKGSVSHILSSVLQEAGHKVGLYTSPHLKDFRERIKINGKEISEKNIITFVEENKDSFQEMKPSFFEMSVAMAFDYFAKEEVDFAIIETGLGGRLDSTNIIRPIMSIITNISFDHQQFLGNTLEAIASEKAGIIKYNVPVVIGETHPKTFSVFVDKAKQENAQIYLADHVYSSEYSFMTTDYKQVFNINKGGMPYFKSVKTDLIGLYQKKNIVTALQAIDIMKDAYGISEENIFEGFLNVRKNTNFMGRWHILAHNPLTVCDTGHNEAGLIEVIKQINMLAFKELHFIYGTVNDKNIDKILALLPKNAKYYFTKANIPRALNEKELAKSASKHNLKGDSFSTVKEAFETAKNNAKEHDLIFVGGSTFVVAEVL